MDFKQHIAIVPDYPKEGIVFKDITPLMNDGKAYKAATDAIVEYAKERDIDLVVGFRSTWLYYRLPSFLCIRSRICASS